MLRPVVAKGQLLQDPFIAGGKDAPFADFSSAAYLLANAFRSNSTTSPDSLPTVKKFKAFMKLYDFLVAAAKKKNNLDATLAAYDECAASLEAFLASVEL